MNIDKKWEVITGNFCHIIPLNDLKEHEESSTCHCEPTLEMLDNGEIMLIHNAYDGRN